MPVSINLHNFTLIYNMYFLRPISQELYPVRGWQIPLPDYRTSASLVQASGFLVHNLITDKLKSRSDKSFENLFVSPSLWLYIKSFAEYSLVY